MLVKIGACVNRIYVWQGWRISRRGNLISKGPFIGWVAETIHRPTLRKVLALLAYDSVEEKTQRGCKIVSKADEPAMLSIFRYLSSNGHAYSSSKTPSSRAKARHPTQSEATSLAVQSVVQVAANENFQMQHKQSSSAIPRAIPVRGGLGSL